MNYWSCIALLLAVCAVPVQAQIYKFVDKDGVTHYTNKKPARSGYTRLNIKCPACKRSVDWHAVPLKLTDYRDEIASASRRHGVDAALIRAVIHAESWFDRFAISTAGAQGLMQLMPATAQRFGVKSPFSPTQNIDGGVRYLRELLERFGNDTELASAAYNAGPEAVTSHGGVPPYAETRSYVRRVRILHQRYLAAMPSVSAG